MTYTSTFTGNKHKVDCPGTRSGLENPAPEESQKRGSGGKVCSALPHQVCGIALSSLALFRQDLVVPVASFRYNTNQKRVWVNARWRSRGDIRQHFGVELPRNLNPCVWVHRRRGADE